MHERSGAYSLMPRIYHPIRISSHFQAVIRVHFFRIQSIHRSLQSESAIDGQSGQPEYLFPNGSKSEWSRHWYQDTQTALQWISTYGPPSSSPISFRIDNHDTASCLLRLLWLLWYLFSLVGIILQKEI